MRERRQVEDDHDLTNGPAKLSEALGITKSLNGTLVNDGLLRILDLDLNEHIGVAAPRVGISKAAKYPFRYFIIGNRFVSKARSKAY
jgi:DNA-3-methyladenine glycosylase